MSVIQEFKDFAIKGNAVDLAIGVVVGAAFGAITTSLVDDIINPIIGLLTGGTDFSNKVIAIGETTINYGSFINTLINFVIIAFVMFMVVKGMNRMRAEESDTKEEESAPPKDIQLLTEIRDSLQK